MYGLVFAAFAGVSALVIVFGRNGWLGRKKIQLGGVLIFLSGAASGCIPPMVTCYSLPPCPECILSTDSFSLDQANPDTGEVTILHSQANTLTGTIAGRTASSFSFVILDANAAVIMTGSLLPLDGSFDASTENFSLDIPAFSIAPGIYSLRFFTQPYSSSLDLNAFNGMVTLNVLH